MSGSTKGLTVFVFADTPNLATQYATQLSQYIQNNPIDNDQISTGLAFPVYDDASQGYMVRIEVLAGALHIMDTAKVIDRGQFSKDCFDDCFWTTQDCKTFLDNGFSFAFTSAFSGDFNTRTNPSKNDCSC